MEEELIPLRAENEYLKKLWEPAKGASEKRNPSAKTLEDANLKEKILECHKQP
ncbi:hypothetical protein [Brevibacillus choshinensis]|uniref:hypothetical protein n=1 Tax=Brevibacillus choshinensis TaxID=54911 RepID=UPI000A85C4F5|nr:hypothetical protein [Brevibacillus choshinensis]